MTSRPLLIGVACALLAACSTGGAAKQQLGIGVDAARRGYWQEANFRFERARAERPNDPEVLNNLAVSLEALGRYDEALEVYKQALALSPRSTAIKRNYARFAEFYTSYARGLKPKEVAGENS